MVNIDTVICQNSTLIEIYIDGCFGDFTSFNVIWERIQNVSDEEIKKQITGDNFLKYKEIVKDDIVKDFRVSMATDEISRLEGIEVPDFQIEEQMQNLKKDVQEGEEFDEASIRPKVETTLLRNLVMDFLAQNANLEQDFTEEEVEFDEALMEQLAQESLQREEEMAAAKAEAEGKDSAEEVVESKAEVEVVEEEAPVAEVSQDAPSPSKEDLDEKYAGMDEEERAYQILVDLGMVEITPDPDSPDYDSSADNEFAS